MSEQKDDEAFAAFVKRGERWGWRDGKDTTPFQEGCIYFFARQAYNCGLRRGRATKRTMTTKGD